LALIAGCRDAAPEVMAPAGQVSVLVFARTDCPITNRYAPELESIRARFKGTPSRFMLIYPSPKETAESVEAHAKLYGLGWERALDPTHHWAKRTGATVTPEAAVFDQRGDLIYRGRIDDRFVALGQARAAPHTHDLIDSIEAALSGRTVRSTTTAAIGCYIGDVQ
jgi:hypothetical protein